MPPNPFLELCAKNKVAIHARAIQPCTPGCALNGVTTLVSQLGEPPVMSSSKGSKRISVFDRLGPGNDEVRPGVVVCAVLMHQCAVCPHPQALQFGEAHWQLSGSGEGKGAFLWYFCAFHPQPYGRHTSH